MVAISFIFLCKYGNNKQIQINKTYSKNRNFKNRKLWIRVYQRHSSADGKKRIDQNHQFHLFIPKKKYSIFLSAYLWFNATNISIQMNMLWFERLYKFSNFLWRFFHPLNISIPHYVVGIFFKASNDEIVFEMRIAPSIEITKKTSFLSFFIVEFCNTSKKIFF